MKTNGSPIRDFAIGIYDGPHATPAESTDGGIFLGIKNFTDDGHLNFSELRYVSEHDLPKWTRRVVPQKGDVVFTYEATLHRYALIPSEFHGCLGRRVALVRPDPKKLDSRFLFYYFRSPRWRSVIESNIITGATVDRIPIERFPDFPICPPNLRHQEKIVSILGSYDGLIHNNNRRIELLEDVARKLYREWFAHLRFAGHEKATVRKGVPDGWDTVSLGDLCVAVREITTPDQVDADTPYIGLEHIPRRSITQSGWGVAADVTSSKHKFRAGDILFGKIRPYFHKVSLAFVDGIASSDAIIMRPNKPEHHSLLLMTVSSDSFVALASQTAKEGSKMPRADWKQMQEFPILLPPSSVLDAFNSQIQPITEQLRCLTFQNRKLRVARDRLLPKLMNGELEI